MQSFFNMISIAIPVYEMKGVGEHYLEINLNQILCQSYKDVEVIISDHSIDDNIKNLCESYKDKLNIVYIRNEEKRGSSSANLNNALKNCSGDLIKILMQDEFLNNTNSLAIICKKFEEDKNLKWLVTGCSFGNSPFVESGKMFPHYSENIIKSVNTIGSPSVLTIRNSDLIFFDEDFLWVMDIDYYKKLFDKYGAPKILNEVLIFVLQHNNQVSNFVSQDRKKQEEQFLLNKYLKK